MEWRYEVQVQTEGGRWFVLATFSRPLDADQLFQMLESFGARRPMRIHMFRELAGVRAAQGGVTWNQQAIVRSSSSCSGSVRTAGRRSSGRPTRAPRASSGPAYRIPALPPGPG